MLVFFHVRLFNDDFLVVDDVDAFRKLFQTGALTVCIPNVAAVQSVDPQVVVSLI